MVFSTALRSLVTVAVVWITHLVTCSRWLRSFLVLAMLCRRSRFWCIRSKYWSKGRSLSSVPGNEKSKIGSEVE